ncbi:MAG: DUF4388 domain-containing protein [Planctomycetota bacterium]
MELVETIRSLAASGSTGLLTVSNGNEEREIYFQDGLIKTVGSPRSETDVLEQALLDSRSFLLEEVEEARRVAADSGKSLAQVLLERGAAKGIDASKILDCRNFQEAARLMAWKRLECRFSAGAFPATLPEAYAARLSGGVDAEEIAEALRRAARRRD